MNAKTEHAPSFCVQSNKIARLLPHAVVKDVKKCADADEDFAEYTIVLHARVPIQRLSANRWWTNMPVQIWHHVASSYLTCQDVANLLCVSRQTKTTCLCNRLWNALYTRDIFAPSKNEYWRVEGGYLRYQRYVERRTNLLRGTTVARFSQNKCLGMAMDPSRRCFVVARLEDNVLVLDVQHTVAYEFHTPPNRSRIRTDGHRVRGIDWHGKTLGYLSVSVVDMDVWCTFLVDDVIYFIRHGTSQAVCTSLPQIPDAMFHRGRWVVWFFETKMHVLDITKAKASQTYETFESLKYAMFTAPDDIVAVDACFVDVASAQRLVVVLLTASRYLAILLLDEETNEFGCVHESRIDICLSDDLKVQIDGDTVYVAPCNRLRFGFSDIAMLHGIKHCVQSQSPMRFTKCRVLAKSHLNMCAEEVLTSLQSWSVHNHRLFAISDTAPVQLYTGKLPTTENGTFVPSIAALYSVPKSVVPGTSFYTDGIACYGLSDDMAWTFQSGTSFLPTMLDESAPYCFILDPRLSKDDGSHHPPCPLVWPVMPFECDNPFRRGLKAGDAVDCRDSENLWYSAKILERKGDGVLVSFDEWTTSHDVWLHRLSPRLQPHKCLSQTRIYYQYEAVAPFVFERETIKADAITSPMFSIVDNRFCGNAALNAHEDAGSFYSAFARLLAPWKSWSMTWTGLRIIKPVRLLAHTLLANVACPIQGTIRVDKIKSMDVFLKTRTQTALQTLVRDALSVVQNPCTTLTRQSKKKIGKIKNRINDTVQDWLANTRDPEDLVYNTLATCRPAQGHHILALSVAANCHIVVLNLEDKRIETYTGHYRDTKRDQPDVGQFPSTFFETCPGWADKKERSLELKRHPTDAGKADAKKSKLATNVEMAANSEPTTNKDILLFVLNRNRYAPIVLKGFAKLTGDAVEIGVQRVT